MGNGGGGGGDTVAVNEGSDDETTDEEVTTAVEGFVVALAVQVAVPLAVTAGVALLPPTAADESSDCTSTLRH